MVMGNVSYLPDSAISVSFIKTKLSHNVNEELLNDYDKFFCTKCPENENVACLLHDGLYKNSRQSIKNASYGLTPYEVQIEFIIYL